MNDSLIPYISRVKFIREPNANFYLFKYITALQNHIWTFIYCSHFIIIQPHHSAFFDQDLPSSAMTSKIITNWFTATSGSIKIK